MKSRHFDILSNRFTGFKDEVGSPKALTSVHEEQLAAKEKAPRPDQPHHKTDYNIIAPTVHVPAGAA